MSSAPTDTHKTFLADLARLVGPSHLLTDPAKTQRYRKRLPLRSGRGHLAVVFSRYPAGALARAQRLRRRR